MRRFFVPVLLAPLLLIALALAQNTRVGPLPSADSLAINQRVGRTGETITQAAGGNNKERVRRGGCYYVAGISSNLQTTVSTTAPFVLYNPQNSGQLISIRKVWVALQSGTIGTGVLYHCIGTSATQTAPSGGTVVNQTTALAGSNSASVAVARVNSTVVAPSVAVPFTTLPGGLTTTSVFSLVPAVDDLDDGIQLLPGTSYQIQSQAAAGTSPVLSTGVFWEEQPLLNGQP